MSDPDVKFSGHTNTMVAIALIASALSLVLSLWSVSRVAQLRAIVVAQSMQAPQAGGGN